IRLAFLSDSPFFAGKALPVGEEKRQQVDLYCDGKFVGTQDIAQTGVFRFEDLPADEKLFELWLPHRSDFALREVEIADQSTLKTYEDERSKWLTYGSSITHCGEAASPSLTWPAIVARERKVNLTCLGYGGQCHLDIQMARMIRDLPADYI